MDASQERAHMYEVVVGHLPCSVTEVIDFMLITACNKFILQLLCNVHLQSLNQCTRISYSVIKKRSERRKHRAGCSNCQKFSPSRRPPSQRLVCSHNAQNTDALCVYLPFA